MKNSEQHFCLRWNNHMSNFAEAVAQLLKTEEFTDVTVAVDDGSSIKCHKMVLAACSSYFQELFTKNPCEHPIIILSDVKFSEIQAILDYMYRGEVNVANDQLPGLFKVASFLKVKGLVQLNDEASPKPEPVEPPYSPLTELAHASAAQAAAEAAIQAAATSSSSNGNNLGNGYTSPLPHVATPFSMPFGKTSPLDSRNAMALWPALAGLHHHHQMPQHPISGHQPPPRGSPLLPGSYENSSDISPLRRKKMSSYMANRDTPILRNVLGGQNSVSPLNDRQDAYSNASSGSIHDSDRRNSSEHSESMLEDVDEPQPPRSPHNNGPHNGRDPNWKRYKKYSREDMANAMLAVKNRQMTALTAAMRFKIPSRTLYDKLKKSGIMPIRGPGTQRAPRRSAEALSCSGSARFPYSSSLNGSVYGNNASSAAGAESDSEVNGYSPVEHQRRHNRHHHHHHHDHQEPSTSSSSPVPPILRGLSLTSRRPSVAEDCTDASGSGSNNAVGTEAVPSSSSNDDGAEDLSVGSRRSSDHSVIVPTGAKEEDDEDETSMHHDES